MSSRKQQHQQQPRQQQQAITHRQSSSSKSPSSPSSPPSFFDNNNHNNNDSDEQLARDLQLALDLQAREEQRALRRRQRQQQLSNSSSSSLDTSPLFLHPDHHMLFISCTLDHVPDVKLLVDTGASSSAMSLDMVQNLGLLPKLNRNIQGSAQGVGSSSPIVGMVENVELFLDDNVLVEFRLYFLVMATPMPCCILGLDQLRKYKCLIDLDAHQLIFGGQGGVSVPFLPQPQARLVAEQMIAASAVAAAAAAAAVATTTSTSSTTVPNTRQQDQQEMSLEGKIKSFFQNK
jgi:Aspartyl protease